MPIVTEAVLSVDLMQCTGDGMKMVRKIYHKVARLLKFYLCLGFALDSAAARTHGRSQKRDTPEELLD